LLHAATWLVARAYRERFADRLSQELPWIPPPSARSVAIGERLARAFLGTDAGAVDDVIESVGHWDVRAPSALRDARAEADAWVEAQLAELG
jgi:hypothetical protein